MKDKGKHEEEDRDTAVSRTQLLVGRYVPEGVSLSDELIAERRAEARREDEEMK